MQKVNWSAKQSFEFVTNYKILQDCFVKLHIDKFIDVARLKEGRYMDNLEFMQWFKRFFELSVQDKGDYDALTQRSRGKGGSTYHGNRSGVKPTNAAPPAVKVIPVSKPNSAVTQKENKAPAPTPVASNPKPAAAKPSSSSAAVMAPSQQKQVATPASAAVNGDSDRHFLKAQQEIENLKLANATAVEGYEQVKVEMAGLEKERDFYFEKLREIEIMLQEIEDSGKGTELTANIFKILYTTADGFEQLEAVDDQPLVDSEIESY